MSTGPEYVSIPVGYHDACDEYQSALRELDEVRHELGAGRADVYEVDAEDQPTDEDCWREHWIGSAGRAAPGEYPVEYHRHTSGPSSPP